MSKEEFLNRLTYGQPHKPITLAEQIKQAQERIKKTPWLYGYKMVDGELKKL